MFSRLLTKSLHHTTEAQTETKSPHGDSTDFRPLKRQSTVAVPLFGPAFVRSAPPVAPVLARGVVFTRDVAHGPPRTDEGLEAM